MLWVGKYTFVTEEAEFYKNFHYNRVLSYRKNTDLKWFGTDSSMGKVKYILKTAKLSFCYWHQLGKYEFLNVGTPLEQTSIWTYILSKKQNQNLKQTFWFFSISAESAHKLNLPLKPSSSSNFVKLVGIKE